MFIRRSAFVKYAVSIVIGAVFFSEFIVYQLQPLSWNRLECASDTSCTKILFIGDPQIQGDNAVPAPFSYLVNWDSDRYLTNTFYVVWYYFRPDILVFMGDLMDEGSISTRQQFHSYAKRLFYIFSVDKPVVTIWVPGDNDIGGENEPIRRDKIKEFAETFNQPNVIVTHNISFYKVNAITHVIPQSNEKARVKANLTVVLSHYPVTVRKLFRDMVEKQINPNIYFCAHEHESKYVIQNKNFRETTEIRNGDPDLDITLKDDSKYEIYVPTCSYRMGTRKIGFGAAVVENNNQRIRYKVFWSPERFPYLTFYLIIVSAFGAYFGIFAFMKWLNKGFRIKEETLPFLAKGEV